MRCFVNRTCCSCVIKGKGEGSQIMATAGRGSV